ncbi:small ribosomal subunit protein mS40-like [Ptychodera flava]|uniref:small ribosomal subunit protein mS40-like n=1 Tax=Ptychodera flava TaxID=63121 RepID=UPI00396A35D5
MAALMRRYAVCWRACVTIVNLSRVPTNEMSRNVPVILSKQQRFLSLTPRLFQDDEDDDVDKPIKPPAYKTWKYAFSEEEIQTGIQYMRSEDYTEKYGKKPVWAGYRRNFKGQVPPMKTRKMCIRADEIVSNPCPICRDQNLVLNYKNVKLLQQFVSPHSGEVYKATTTGVCQRQHERLEKEIEEARYRGLMPMSVPHIEYDYSLYYGEDSKTNKAIQ